MSALTLPCTPPTVTAPCFNTPGPLQIWVGTGALAAMEFLGYTRGGARINEHAFWDELKSDASGGERGPVADWQFLGETHQVELELAQYVEAILAKVELRVNAANPRSKGQLLHCSGAQFRLVLVGVNFARNYTNSFMIEPIERAPIGFNTTYPRLTFTCLEDPANVAGTNGAPTNGSPWNQAITISGSTLS